METLLTTLALTLVAQLGVPIQKVGPACPLGYYSQGAYCTPSAGVGRYTEAFPRAGSSCPWGWYRQGDYCTRNAPVFR